MDSDVHPRPLLSSDIHHMINTGARHFAKVHSEARHLYAQARRQQVALQVREKRHVRQAMLIRVVKTRNTSGVVTSSRSLRSNHIFHQDRRRSVSLHFVPVVALLSLFSFGGVKFPALLTSSTFWPSGTQMRSMPVVSEQGRGLQLEEAYLTSSEKWWLRSHWLETGK